MILASLQIVERRYSNSEFSLGYLRVGVVPAWTVWVFVFLFFVFFEYSSHGEPQLSRHQLIHFAFLKDVAPAAAKGGRGVLRLWQAARPLGRHPQLCLPDLLRREPGAASA